MEILIFQIYLDDTNTKQNKQYTIKSELLLGGHIVIFFGQTACTKESYLMFQCITVAVLKTLAALWLAPKSMAIYGTQFFYDPNFQRGNPINIFLHSHMISPAQMLSRKGNQYWFLSSTRVRIEKKYTRIAHSSFWIQKTQVVCPRDYCICKPQQPFF